MRDRVFTAVQEIEREGIDQGLILKMLVYLQQDIAEESKATDKMPRNKEYDPLLRDLKNIRTDNPKTG